MDVWFVGLRGKAANPTYMNPLTPNNMFRYLRFAILVGKALRHTLQERRQTPLSRFEYGSQVQQTYARYPDSDAGTY